MNKVFIAPRRYVQGRNVLKETGVLVGALGKRVLTLWDGQVKGIVGETLLASLKGTDNLAEVQFLIGASQFQLGNFEAAAKALRAANRANPKWQQADETWLLLSRVQRQQHQLKEALATVRKLLADFPESPQAAQAHYRLGEYSYAANDHKTAIKT